MPINMPDQLESNWCWAAVTVGVKTFFSPGSAFTQCDVATSVLTGEGAIHSINCCANRELCNIPAFLQDALHFSGNLKGILSGPLPFSIAPGPSVTGELNAGRPVGVRIQWPEGNGHFLVVDGYREFTVGPPQVHVADPLFQDVYWPYGDLLNNYQFKGGVWTDTFLLQP
jgi:hypothetical protein